MRALLEKRFPEAPRLDVATGQALVAADVGAERLGAWFFSWFGIVELALGVAGVFGVVSYLVQTRRREFGIRMALGATRGQIFMLAVRGGLTPAAIGCAAGIPLAITAVKVLEWRLVGMLRPDVLAYVQAVGVLMLCAIGAAVLGAAGARRLDLVETLHVS